MTDAGSAWFYAAANDRKGPLPEAEILGLIRSGAINGETLMWTEGMAGWEPLRATPLAVHLSVPPPMGHGAAAEETRLAPMPPQAQSAYAGAVPPGGPGQAASGYPPNAAYANPAYGQGMFYTGPTAPGEPVESLPDAVKAVYSKYVTFQGRAARPEFWWFVLFFIIAEIVTMAIDGLATFGALTTILVLGSFLPNISVIVRRLHDIDKSGWWYWIALIPLVGIIWLIVLLCTPGTPGPNRFGPPPPRRPK